MQEYHGGLGLALRAIDVDQKISAAPIGVSDGFKRDGHGCLMISRCRGLRKAERILDSIMRHQMLAEQSDRAHRLRMAEVTELERQHHVVGACRHILVEERLYGFRRTGHEA